MLDLGSTDVLTCLLDFDLSATHLVQPYLQCHRAHVRQKVEVEGSSVCVDLQAHFHIEATSGLAFEASPRLPENPQVQNSVGEIT